MKKKFIFLFILFVSISLSVLSQVNIKKSNKVVVFNGKEFYIHIVEKGHTLYSLARVYEIPMNEIIFENPSSKDKLSIGQELKIPVKSRDLAVDESLKDNNTEFFYHVVKSGETMKRIASLYLISQRDLEHSNPNLYDPLKKGQYVKIPVGAKKVSPKIDQPVQSHVKQEISKNTSIDKTKNLEEHVIKAGDNLYRIALKYQISIEEIKNVNPGLNEDALNIGQRIKIPLKKKKSDFIIHKVNRKTKLSRIARNYNIDIQTLRDYNPKALDKLYSGETVKIPINEEAEVKQEPSVIFIPPVVDELSVDVILNQDSLQCVNYIGNVMDTLEIALMIPLYLEQVDSLKFTEDTNVEEFLEENPFRFLQFYYGAMMAVDSLRALGVNVKLTVFDVDNSIGKTIQVLQDPRLSIQDLIIGPFFSRSFKLASNFAKIFEIPIVNPLSNRSEVLEDNPFVYKCQSTTDFQYNQVRNMVATYFRNSKIFLVKHEYEPTKQELEFPKYFAEIQDLIDTGYYIPNVDVLDLIIKKSLVDTSTVHIYNEFMASYDSITGKTAEIDSLIVEDELLSFISLEGVKILTDSIEFNLYDSTYIKNSIVQFYYATDSIYGFENEASIYRNNVVLVFADDNVFALDLMTKLNILRDTFPTTLVGLPNWQEFENMDNEMLSNLKTHILSSTYVNYQDKNTNSFIYEFRKRHLTEPLDYAFKGFDISWYFLNALKNYGKDFKNCLPYYSQSSLQSKMEFERTKAEDGFENRYWTILKYDGYLLKEVEVSPPEHAVIEDIQLF